jgi:acyl-CoA reductase-like NAD-dependent aldehyde dehydrogenase
MQLNTPFQLENFIDGEFHHPSNGQHIDNINPATAEVYGQIPKSSDIDIQVAINAAKKHLLAGLKHLQKLGLNCSIKLLT